MWTLVPLGNPGPDYQDTRHNLGRLLLQRWMANRDLAPKASKRFPSGSLYPLTDRLQALVPATYMNLSGEVCAQAEAAGLYPRRMVLLYDDKDLPLRPNSANSNLATSSSCTAYWRSTVTFIESIPPG